MATKKSPSKVARPVKKPLGEKWAHLKKMITPVGQVQDPLTALLYGRAGSGKTVTAATFPKPLLILDIKERGTESIAESPDIDVVQISTWEQFEQFYWYIVSGDHRYKTVVVDHLSQLQELAIATLRAKLNLKSDDAFHKGQWGTVSGQLKEWILNYRDLRDKGMAVCFVAHDRQFGGEETEDNQIDPSIGPRLMPSVSSFVNGAVSVIGNCFIRETFIKGEKGKKIRKVEYCMRVGPHASYVTKIRKPITSEIQLPDIIVNPSYEKLMKIARGEELRKVKQPVRK
jgi:AAA domain